MFKVYGALNIHTHTAQVWHRAGVQGRFGVRAGEGGTAQGTLHGTMGPPPWAKALGHRGGKDIPVSEVPAVEK